MEAVILRSSNIAMLDHLVSTFVIGKPVFREGKRIGSIIAVRREDNKLIATVEVVPEDGVPKKRDKWPT